MIGICRDIIDAVLASVVHCALKKARTKATVARALVNDDERQLKHICMSATKREPTDDTVDVSVSDKGSCTNLCQKELHMFLIKCWQSRQGEICQSFQHFGRSNVCLRTQYARNRSVVR